MLDVNSLPPVEAVEHELIRAAIDAYQSARASARDARKDLVRFERERESALQRDIEATADALSAGKRDPAGKHLAAFEAKLADLQRQVAALELLERRKVAELTTTFAEHRAEWQAELDRQLADVRIERDLALDAAEALHGKLATVYALRGFAREPQRYRGAQAYVRQMRMPRVGDGDAVEVSGAFAALRNVGSEPVARITNPAMIVRRWCVQHQYGDDALRGPNSLIGHRVEHDGHVYGPGAIFNAPIDREVQAAISQGTIRELKPGTMLQEQGTREFQVGHVSGAER